MKAKKDIAATVASFYRSRGIETGECVAVAFSGGSDSVALLAATVAAGYRCVALHCNFHLRGEESDRDERFARDMARRLGCEILTVNFDVGERRRLTGESVEMACRSLRYEWFERMFAEADGAWRCIAVAHHADDNVETVMLNLMRGTGLRGLGGIPPVRGIFVRPLLTVSRSEILGYLQDENLSYVVDSTNLMNDCRRNLLRNKAIPAIEADFPSLRKSVAATACNVRRDMELLDSFVSDVARRLTDTRGRIDLDAVANEPCAVTLLYHLLNRGEGAYGYGAAQLMLRNRRSGAVYMSENGMGGYLLDRGRLVPFEGNSPAETAANMEADITDVVAAAIAGEDRFMMELPLALEGEVTAVESFAPVRNPSVIWLDAGALAEALDGGDHMVLRHWREGDRLMPFGMKGSRLLSDIFSDAKLSLSEKSAVWLLACGDRILWVPGLRTSRFFTVNDFTKKVLNIKLTR